MAEPIKRILELMAKQGDTYHSLEVNAKLPISSVYGWKTNKCKPSMVAIIKLARYFNVSADYLLCLTDKPTPLVKEQTTSIIKHSTALSTELVNLSQDKNFVDSAKLYNAMAEEYKQQICAYIIGIATGLGLNIQKILGR